VLDNDNVEENDDVEEYADSPGSSPGSNNFKFLSFLVSMLQISPFFIPICCSLLIVYSIFTQV
jgi:hypothetical protein